MKRHFNNHELRAVIFALEIGRDADFALNGSAFLMPLTDKPVVQQVIESVVRCGVTHVDVVVASDHDSVQAIINEVLCWGIRVEVHRPVDVQRPYSILRRFAANCTSMTGRILLVHADRFCPKLPIEEFTGNSQIVAFTFEDHWTGTALLMQSDLATRYRLNTGRRLLGEAIMEQARQSGRTVSVVEPISLNSGSDYLRSQRRILNNEFPELLRQAKTAEAGIWIGRNTRLHPTARLTAPVFIGANCVIGRGVRLGPNAVIESESFLGKKVTATNSLVLSGSCVGAGIDLADAIVCGRKVYNARINASINICDDVLISDLRAGNVAQMMSHLFSRLMAIILLPLIWLPALCLLRLVSLLTGRLQLQSMEFVRTPTHSNRYTWRSSSLVFWSAQNMASNPIMAVWQDLLHRVIPGLPAVAKGALKLIGVSPRSSVHLEGLPPHWKDRLLNAPTGLISESLIQFGPFAPSDPCCVADLWHTASDRRFSKLVFLCRYLKTLLVGPVNFIQAAERTVFDSANSVVKPTIAQSNSTRPTPATVGA